MNRLGLLLLALPLSLGCSVDASGLTPDDQFDALGDDSSLGDALFETGPGDDSSLDTQTSDTADAPLFEAADGGCLDAKTDCPPPPACRTATCSAGVCGTSNVASGTTCASGVCDGNGACVQCLTDANCPTATPVCTNKICVAASCTDGKKDGGETDVDCGGATSCARCALGDTCVANGDCASNQCTGGHCVCTQDAQCGSGKYCDAGACKNQLTQGTKCTAADQCTTGFCVDGVCCDTACDGICVACLGSKKQSGPDGTCGAAKDNTDPHSTCTAAPPCGDTGVCVAGACQVAPATTQCAAASCSGHTFTAASYCSGAGSCSTTTTTIDCTPYVCNGGPSPSCKTSCGSPSDCVSGYTCTGSVCVALKTNGQVCGGNAQCASGNCVSGICCNTACSTTCYGCGTGTCSPLSLGSQDFSHTPQCVYTSGLECNGSGACLAVTGASCSTNADCASNNCILNGGSGKGTCG